MSCLLIMLNILIIIQAQEDRVKKQFRETCKIQERQYKLLRKQTLANAPREEHQAIINKFEEDRMRKFADLGSQYEHSISDLLQKQKVNLVNNFYIRVPKKRNSSRASMIFLTS